MMPGRIGQIGWKSIEMMPGQIGWKSIEMMPGRIGWKSIEMMPGQIGWKSIETMPGRIGQIGHHLNGFPPNSTRQAYNVISMDFHPI